MNLSAEQFQAVVQSLRLDEAGAAPSPLQARRVMLCGKAIITPCAGERYRPMEARARDISPTGIALTVPLRMIRGQQFILHVPRTVGNGVIAADCDCLLCTVARYQYLDESRYILGATFTQALVASPFDPCGRV